MSLLGKKIKSLLYSKFTPEFLFAYYVDRKKRVKQQRLQDIISQQKDFMAQESEVSKKHWEPRIADTIACQDNKDIPRHPQAGLIQNNLLTMHNGIRIDPLSYYSFPMLKMLAKNKGVHEPQEEKIFQEVIKSLSVDSSKTMIELGAYWSFYSIWFQKNFPTATNIMVEPERGNLLHGKRNAKINQVNGTFIHAGIGKSVNKSQNITTVDTICKKQKIDFIDLLHSDIQGFEFDMLHGCKEMLSNKKVGYIFISTHSNELHYQCRDLLATKYGYTLVASADLDETYSWDGILVMKLPGYKGIEQVNISKKAKSTS